MVNIVLKWNKEKFEDVELDTTGSVEDFKATCMSLTVSFNTEMYRWILWSIISISLFTVSYMYDFEMYAFF